MFKRFGILLVVLAILVTAGVAYAFAAGITYTTNPDNVASGAKALNGYAVSNFVFTYASGGTDYSQITEIDFDIAPTTATTVRIQTASGGAWTTCTNTAGAVVCDYSGSPLDVSTFTALNVFASE